MTIYRACIQASLSALAVLILVNVVAAEPEEATPCETCFLVARQFLDSIAAPECTVGPAAEPPESIRSMAPQGYCRFTVAREGSEGEGYVSVDHANHRVAVFRVPSVNVAHTERLAEWPVLTGPARALARAVFQKLGITAEVGCSLERDVRNGIVFLAVYPCVSVDEILVHYLPGIHVQVEACSGRVVSGSLLSPRVGSTASNLPKLPNREGIRAVRAAAVAATGSDPDRRVDVVGLVQLPRSSPEAEPSWDVYIILGDAVEAESGGLSVGVVRLHGSKTSVLYPRPDSPELPQGVALAAELDRTFRSEAYWTAMLKEQDKRSETGP